MTEEAEVAATERLDNVPQNLTFRTTILVNFSPALTYGIDVITFIKIHFMNYSAGNFMGVFATDSGRGMTLKDLIWVFSPSL